MRVSRSFVLALGAVLLGGAGARADNVRHPTAIFAGLDKITGRIISFDVAIDETVQFGTLQITPRVCLTRPQTEAPLTEGFVEVDELDAAKTSKRIFSGWMFSASPGLHGVEHPVYDVWLKDCKGGVEVTPSPVNAKPDANKPPPANAAPPPAPGSAARTPRRTIEPQEPVEPSVESLPPSDVDAPPGAAPIQPGAPDQGLGAPIEIGPGPGGGRPPSDGALRSGQPDSPDQGFGAPVEVGPGPGGASQGSGVQPPAAKPPKPRRKPPADPNAAPLPPADIPPAAPQPQPQRQQPSGPQDLLKNLPFIR